MASATTTPRSPSRRRMASTAMPSSAAELAELVSGVAHQACAPSRRSRPPVRDRAASRGSLQAEGLPEFVRASSATSAARLRGQYVESYCRVSTSHRSCGVGDSGEAMTRTKCDAQADRAPRSRKKQMSVRGRGAAVPSDPLLRAPLRRRCQPMPARGSSRPGRWARLGRGGAHSAVPRHPAPPLRRSAGRAVRAPSGPGRTPPRQQSERSCRTSPAAMARAPRPRSPQHSRLPADWRRTGPRRPRCYRQ
jgi:hypothetical protein